MVPTRQVYELNEFREDLSPLNVIQQGEATAASNEGDKMLAYTEAA